MHGLENGHTRYQGETDETGLASLDWPERTGIGLDEIWLIRDAKRDRRKTPSNIVHNAPSYGTHYRHPSSNWSRPPFFEI
jgi:hypothetical protein